MKPKPFENPTAFVQGMLGSLYQNSRGYASTIGELNALLWFVHHLWAGIANRDAEFLERRSRLYNEDFARLVEPFRHQPITNQESKNLVIDLWKKIDDEMGIDINPDQYQLPV